MKVDIREIEPAVYSVLRGGKSFTARVIPSLGGYLVEVDGREFVLDVRDPRDAARRETASAGAGRQNLTASMPGKVVRVLVTEGQEVASGQGLIVVEAMKMQNEIKAAKPGRVAKIHVQDGATVEAGEALLIIE